MAPRRHTHPTDTVIEKQFDKFQFTAKQREEVLKYISDFDIQDKEIHSIIVVMFLLNIYVKQISTDTTSIHALLESKSSTIAEDVLKNVEQRLSAVTHAEQGIKEASDRIAHTINEKTSTLSSVSTKLKKTQDQLGASIVRLCIREGRGAIGYGFAIVLSLAIGASGVLSVQAIDPEIRPADIIPRIIKKLEG